MDAEQLKTLIEQAVQEGWTAEWWIYLIVLIFTLLGSFLGAYLTIKGQHFATKEDFGQLLKQQEQTTRATEGVKAEISKTVTVGQSELEFRKQQLADFYGPIYSYLKLNEHVSELWQARKLDEINEEVKALFREQNRKIYEIVTLNAHLVDGDQLPPIFTRYMTAATLWNLYTEKLGQYPEHVEKLETSQFPPEFQVYIYQKTEELKRIVYELHNKYGITQQ